LDREKKGEKPRVGEKCSYTLAQKLVTKEKQKRPRQNTKEEKTHLQTTL
jgi:hypothetical protein